MFEMRKIFSNVFFLRSYVVSKFCGTVYGMCGKECSEAFCYFSRSGRRRRVRSIDSLSSHSLILASLPLSSPSGTFHPL